MAAIREEEASLRGEAENQGASNDLADHLTEVEQNEVSRFILQNYPTTVTEPDEGENTSLILASPQPSLESIRPFISENLLGQHNIDPLYSLLNNPSKNDDYQLNLYETLQQVYNACLAKIESESTSHIDILHQILKIGDDGNFLGASPLHLIAHCHEPYCRDKDLCKLLKDFLDFVDTCIAYRAQEYGLDVTSFDYNFIIGKGGYVETSLYCLALYIEDKHGIDNSFFTKWAHMKFFEFEELNEKGTNGCRIADCVAYNSKNFLHLISSLSSRDLIKFMRMSNKDTSILHQCCRIGRPTQLRKIVQLLKTGHRTNTINKKEILDLLKEGSEGSPLGVAMRYGKEACFRLIIGLIEGLELDYPISRHDLEIFSAELDDSENIYKEPLTVIRNKEIARFFSGLADIVHERIRNTSKVLHPDIKSRLVKMSIFLETEEAKNIISGEVFSWTPELYLFEKNWRYFSVFFLQSIKCSKDMLCQDGANELLISIINKWCTDLSLATMLARKEETGRFLQSICLNLKNKLVYCFQSLCSLSPEIFEKTTSPDSFIKKMNTAMAPLINSLGTLSVLGAELRYETVWRGLYTTISSVGSVFNKRKIEREFKLWRKLINLIPGDEVERDNFFTILVIRIISSYKNELGRAYKSSKENWDVVKSGLVYFCAKKIFGALFNYVNKKESNKILSVSDVKDILKLFSKKQSDKSFELFATVAFSGVSIISDNFLMANEIISYKDFWDLKPTTMPINTATNTEMINSSLPGSTQATVNFRQTDVSCQNGTEATDSTSQMKAYGFKIGSVLFIIIGGGTVLYFTGRLNVNKIVKQGSIKLWCFSRKYLTKIIQKSREHPYVGIGITAVSASIGRQAHIYHSQGASSGSRRAIPTAQTLMPPPRQPIEFDSPVNKILQWTPTDFICGTVYGSLYLYVARQGIVCAKRRHMGKINGMLKLNDSQLVTVSDDGCVILWEVEVNNVVFKEYIQQEGMSVNAIERLTATTFVIGSNDSTVRILNTTDDQPVQEITTNASIMDLTCMNNTIIAGKYNGQVEVWAYNTEADQYLTRTNFDLPHPYLAFGRTLLITDLCLVVCECNTNRSLTEWIPLPGPLKRLKWYELYSYTRNSANDNFSPESRQRFGYHDTPINLILKIPKEDLIIIGSTDGDIKIWNTKNATCVRDFQLKGQPVSTACLTEEGQLVVCFNSGEIRYINVPELMSAEMNVTVHEEDTATIVTTNTTTVPTVRTTTSEAELVNVLNPMGQFGAFARTETNVSHEPVGTSSQTAEQIDRKALR